MHNDKKTIWLISDTHEQHMKLHVPVGADAVVCTGDVSSYRSPAINEKGMRDFLSWYNVLPVDKLYYIPGNHDTSIEANYIDFKEYPNINVIINKPFDLYGHKAYGSPYTPAFSFGWAYNIKRGQEEAMWNGIPEDTEILFTHGPAYNTLDRTAGEGHQGCKALEKRISELYNLKLHVFGHFHNEYGIQNAGVTMDYKTTYINASVVDIRHNLINNGIIFRL